jgi:iron complex transport system ATP-binding protein
MPATAAPDAALTLRAEALGHQFSPSWWVLRDIDLEFREGEFVGMVGPNGAGKTTLLRALVGQIAPAHGRVALGGRPLAGWSRLEIARRVGYLPQDVPALFDYTCEEVVAQGRYPHLGAFGLLGRRDLDIVRRAMAWTNCDAFAHRPLALLSGGERQRVLLASVLAQESRFLLLDEPTAALDIHQQLDVVTRLATLARDGLCVVIVTHDLNLAAQFCGRLVMLHEGRVAGSGPPAEVMTEPMLKKVYETDLVVARSPVSGAPMVVLKGRPTDRDGVSPAGGVSCPS